MLDMIPDKTSLPGIMSTFFQPKNLHPLCYAFFFSFFMPLKIAVIMLFFIPLCDAYAPVILPYYGPFMLTLGAYESYTVPV